MKKPVQCPGIQPPETRTIKKRVYCGRCGRLLREYSPETQMVTAIVCPCYEEDYRELRKT